MGQPPRPQLPGGLQQLKNSSNMRQPSSLASVRLGLVAWWMLLTMAILSPTGIRANSDIVTAVSSTLPETTCTVGADGSQVCEEISAKTSGSGDESDDETMTAPVPSMGDSALPDDCRDQEDECTYWSALGECETNPAYMLTMCARSCKSCENTKISEVTKLYGEQQYYEDEATTARIEDMHKYMTETVFVNASYAKVQSECKNRHGDCAYWASSGECENNKNFMLTECAPACFSCELIDFDVRCPFDRNAPKAWEKAGDLDRFFEGLLAQTADKPQYKPTLHSGPAKYTASVDIDDTSRQLVTVPPNAIVDGPWVLTLENVLTDEECEHLIQLGHKSGYARSLDVGAKKFDGSFDSFLNPDRTSTNTWCNEECYNDDIVQKLTKRFEDLTGIPANHSEYWQLLRYEESEKYDEHHDLIDYQLDRAEGLRILTIFFYLSTVEEGGGTHFSKLDLTVQPVKGRVLIWPSVLNEDPDAQDIRTTHQALPVEKGIKFAANAWVHQRDFKTPNNNGC